MVWHLRSSILWHLENKYLWGFLFACHKSQGGGPHAPPTPINKHTHIYLPILGFQRSAPTRNIHSRSISFHHSWFSFKAQWNDPQAFHIETMMQYSFWILHCHLRWSHPSITWWDFMKHKVDTHRSSCAYPQCSSTILMERFWNPISTQGIS